MDTSHSQIQTYQAASLLRSTCQPRADGGWTRLHVATNSRDHTIYRQIRARRVSTVHATGSGQQQQQQIEDLKAFAATPIFKYWIQGAVFLVVLAGVDAAYSGDWSRIGVISKEFEDSLKPLVVALGFFHIGCAFVAGKEAAAKNLNVLPAVLKVLAVGFLAMVEVLAAEPQPSQQ